MLKDVTKIWKTSNAQQFANALAAIEDVKTMQSFLRDIMTEKEITEMSARLEAARMLANKERYTDVTTATQLSSRTVARISDWLQNGCSGYEAALKIVNTHHTHIPPARAE